MQLTHWIDGEARPAAGGRWLDVFDPATGAAFAQVARGDARDVDAAIAAAERAFPAWSALPNAERARWMERLADALEARLEDFARAESRDGGKPLKLAREIEIPRAISNLRIRLCGRRVENIQPAAARRFAWFAVDPVGEAHVASLQGLGAAAVDRHVDAVDVTRRGRTQEGDDSAGF